MGEHESTDGDESQSEINGACTSVSKRSGVVWDEWSQADHLRLKILDKSEILDDVFERLSRTAYHDARTGLKPYVFERPETLDTIVPTHPLRVQFAIMSGIEGLVSEEITIGTGSLETSVLFGRLLPEGKGDGTVGIGLSHLGDEVDEPVDVLSGILAPLEDEGAQAQGIPFGTTRHHILV